MLSGPISESINKYPALAVVFALLALSGVFVC